MLVVPTITTTIKQFQVDGCNYGHDAKSSNNIGSKNDSNSYGENGHCDGACNICVDDDKL